MKKGLYGLARQDFSSYASINSALIEQGYNTGYSQFFIMASNESGFNSLYTAFGKVIEGIEIVEKISNLETKIETDEETGEETTTSEPVEKPVIKSITVETYGIEYGDPELVETFDIESYINQYLMNYYGLEY